MGKRIILDPEYIKSLPLTTNRIEVTWNKEVFFEKYAIVSYFCKGNDHKNLAYEQLADLPFLSVTGIRARWQGQGFAGARFFVLVKKGEENNVLQSLRSYDDVVSKIDNLEDYNEKLQQRIIATLAINSLGKKRNSTMMYNDASLLVCDDLNFGARKSRKELVCLKIEVNEYMNLTAKTTSFSNPFNDNELRKHRTCVFQVGKDFDGEHWSGQAVKPVTIKNVNNGQYYLKTLFIKKKKFNDNKNTVPYWPYDTNKYAHGKLFVLWQVAKSVNDAFKGIITINFSDSQVIYYDECKTEKDTERLLKDYLSGRKISFDNPFSCADSKAIIDSFKEEAQQIMNDSLIFPSKQTPDDMIIRLCEPKDDDSDTTFYSQSMNRLMSTGNALQHIIFDKADKEQTVASATVRRILLELIVKDCTQKQVMPDILTPLLTGWKFYRYKINQGTVHGASLLVDVNGIMQIEQFGLSQSDYGVDFETFVDEHLHYHDYDKIRGARDYMAMVKNGNVFLIIDTDEIPILDVEQIDEAYGKVVNEGESLSMFKRKADSHNYLRGYIGFHLWKTEGLNGEPGTSYSYISGTNSESMKITPGTKMDKMPRARRIFILHNESPDNIESQIMEICSMVKFGFGRWNELMTYPVPFKFLQEYLDNATEIAYSMHWKDITYNKDL